MKCHIWPGLKLQKTIKVDAIELCLWFITYQHLIHDDTQAPPITQLVVSILHKDLWGDVVWGSHCGESLTGRRRHKEQHKGNDKNYTILTIYVFL